MKIQILGPGCVNCSTMENHAREAAAGLGINAEFEKITDTNQIVEMGVMRTPGLAFDGSVQKSGQVLSAEQIKELLTAYQGA